MLARTSWITDISVKAIGKFRPHARRSNGGIWAGIAERWDPPVPAYKKLVSRRERETLVSQTAETLRFGTPSLFRFEASTREGLRRGFIALGHSWAHSNMEAEKIVASALDRIGAIRPEWLEAQAIATVSPDYCQQCYSPLDDSDKSRHRRFCGEICARAARNHDAEIFSWVSKICATVADYRVRKEEVPARICSVCGDPFQSIVATATTCSKICAGALRRTVSERQCQHCSKPFRPHSDKYVGKFCSKSCASTSRRLPPRQCQHCLGIFPPKKPKSRFCSSVCAASFQQPCVFCGAEFVPTRADARTCSRRCQYAEGKRKRTAMLVSTTCEPC